LVIAPISITVYIAWLFISFIDQKVFSVLPPVYNPETYLPFSIPGIGVVLMLVGLTLIGALTAGYVGKVFLRLSERVLNRMPIVRSIYGAAKQIVETVVSNKSSAFREVALVEYPRKGVWTLCFLTGRTIDQIGDVAGPRLVNIFVPTTPNPTFRLPSLRAGIRYPSARHDGRGGYQARHLDRHRHAGDQAPGRHAAHTKGELSQRSSSLRLSFAG
jgi:uncharacterized membrane protein